MYTSNKLLKMRVSYSGDPITCYEDPSRPNNLQILKQLQKPNIHTCLINVVWCIEFMI